MLSLRQLGLALRIGSVYIGTAVGAGFASGQEILQFFTSFGKDSFWGILLAVGLFAWLGTRMIMMGSRLHSESYEDFNFYLFGERLGKWMNWLVSFMLFGVTTAMMSGTGALFEEQLGISFHFGVIFTALFSYLVILKGINGILSVNSLVVPVMFLFIGMVALHALQETDLSAYIFFSLESARYHWFVSAIIYVAFNLSMMQAVLIPLGSKIADESVIRLGGIMGGIGLGIMLFACNTAMQIYWAEVSHLKIPMAFVISTLGAGVKYFFLLIMWAEIFTTLIGNVYGLTLNLKQLFNLGQPLIMALIFGLGYLFSLFGFPALVGFLYPLFGYAGLAVIFGLVFRRLPA
ncbi:YkvI family membrane protein [Thermoactinomyces mirandus]|uniref:Membrane protein YkvI n=1 Tax=Thermoactinomyces mirandus TaxID=2756294 RepID=A0A7W1XTN0_9BACL|nr:hypothetical protein [Thermoactinomyces mirandus]MBA4603039.1 hypothetical protein [Thermoactinomyces mirandus]